MKNTIHPGDRVILSPVWLIDAHHGIFYDTL